MENRTVLYRTIFKIEVLSSDPIEDLHDLTSIDYNIIRGGWSGSVDQEKSKPLSFNEAIEAIEKHGTDPELFGLIKLEGGKVKKQ